MVSARTARGDPPFLAIIIDNQMPNMSGSTAMRKLRTELGYSHLAIGITGDPSGSTDRDDFESAGLDLCVDKTSEGMRHLEEIIRERLRRMDAGLDES